MKLDLGVLHHAHMQQSRSTGIGWPIAAVVEAGFLPPSILRKTPGGARYAQAWNANAFVIV
jgi:hypothetical protein